MKNTQDSNKKSLYLGIFKPFYIAETLYIEPVEGELSFLADFCRFSVFTKIKLMALRIPIEKLKI